MSTKDQHRAAATEASNPLPRWRGFNLLDFFWPDPSRRRDTTTRHDLAWMAKWGFDFVRLPMAYPAYLRFDRSKPITPEEVYQIDEQVVEQIDTLVAMVHEHGLHVSLNLHRAPGYCITARGRVMRSIVIELSMLSVMAPRKKYTPASGAALMKN